MSTVNIQRVEPRPQPEPIEEIVAKSAHLARLDLKIQHLPHDHEYAALASSTNGNGIHLTAKQVRDLATALDELATQVGA